MWRKKTAVLKVYKFYVANLFAANYCRTHQMLSGGCNVYKDRLALQHYEFIYRIIPISVLGNWCSVRIQLATVFVFILFQVHGYRIQPNISYKVQQTMISKNIKILQQRIITYQFILLCSCQDCLKNNKKFLGE